MIGQAQAVSSSLGEQRGLFDNIGTKLAGVSGKFPVVNGVLNSIRRKKNKVRSLPPFACVAPALIPPTLSPQELQIGSALTREVYVSSNKVCSFHDLDMELLLFVDLR